MNADRTALNALIFVNHDDASHYGDLQETLTGMFLADDGTLYPTMMNIAEGRIGEARRRIDLYGWIDAKTGRVQGYLFNDEDPARVQRTCDLFGLDRGNIAS